MIDPWAEDTRTITSAMVEEIVRRAMTRSPNLSPGERDAYELGAIYGTVATVDVLNEQRMLIGNDEGLT